MQLSETVKLYPTEYQIELIRNTMSEYISTVNNIVSDYTNKDNGNIESVKEIKNIKSISKLTTADVKAKLPSALCNQCIRDAKSIVKKYDKACKEVEKAKKNKKNQKSKKNKNSKNVKEVEEIKEVKKLKEIKVPVLKKLCCYINNQNFKIQDNYISFPVMIDGKSKRISVKTKMTDKQKLILSSHRLGTMRIVIKNINTLVAQFVYEINEIEKVNESNNVMGVDLGIKCPAVSYCTDGSVKFYGNGRKNKYMRRHYANLRKWFQKAKKPTVAKRIKNKEQRIMKDIDHKISREIVNTAKKHKAKVIKLERLENIRSTTRTSRKNNPSLHTWSFYRLVQYIEYKAKLAGIEVEYVYPAYTSQKCPQCGNIHHAKDRKYICKCGYHTHRDLLGAINICNSTEYIGNRCIA
ncbi:MAG: RNA-guided endonuclease InsQ/TnpB family protein [Faecalibacillus intestinalis]|uniref:RNA-guided endonuclease InsQ/TnpB family protein n=1 Tax=Faecalibacillus intestinalis TaxID=1982626 RepID=UPI00295EE391|nr:transposase [Faecalibacillus intestinalis]